MNKRKFIVRFLEKAEDCILEAVDSGDIIDSPISAKKLALFMVHFGFMMMTNNLPPTPVLHLGTQHELVKDVVWFTLRGIGLKEEVIKRQYNSKAPALAS